MSSKLVILCVEDEAEVRDAVIRDLEPFKSHFRLEAAEDVEDARDILKECAAADQTIALFLCDHMMPGVRGVDFLIEMQLNATYAAARKVLITGQAGLEDTIRAVNDAHLHHYIAKPWTATDLQQVVRDQLTEYVLASDLDPIPYVGVLDGPRLLEQVARGH
jgi:two-component system, OmpR family, phosphate regulon response regulator PhoB